MFFGFVFVVPQVKIYKKNLCKIVNTFLPISFSIHFGCSKKPRLIETVLLSTHNICFGSEIRKLFWCVFEMVLLSTHKISFGSEIRKLIFFVFLLMPVVIVLLIGSWCLF